MPLSLAGRLEKHSAVSDSSRDVVPGHGINSDHTMPSPGTQPMTLFR